MLETTELESRLIGSMEQAYTIDELAELWKVNHKTIRGMIDRHELRAFKVGRDWRISRSEVADYQERNECRGRVVCVVVKSPDEFIHVIAKKKAPA